MSLQAMSKEAQKSAKSAIVSVANKVLGDAQYGIQTGSRSGKIYERGKGRTHQASAAGEFPKTDYGDLVANITAEFSLNKLEATVGSRKSAPHGFTLEFGTSKVAARPWLQPTLDKNQNYIQRRFDKALSNIAGKF